jgi:hypothetical protein
MSKITNRDTAAPDGVEHRLARLLEGPFLARVVPYLPPETLHRLIRYRGLDACGALVTSATPAQLASLLDLDLWRQAQPKADERFDADRFGEWLEVLVDAGDSVAARTVAALDESLVIAGLSRYVRVFDPGIFEPVAQSDDEPVDREEAMREGDDLHVDEPMDEAQADDAPMHDPSGLECEMGGYVVRARRADAWDAIVALLVALEAEHGRSFHAVMQGCRRLSHSRPEIDGLDDLLLAPEQHLHEVGIEREQRRSQQGYATPADARAFLQMARQPKRARSGASVANPIVAAYFRAADEAPESSTENARAPQRALERSTSNAHEEAPDAESIAAAVALLAEAGMMPSRRLLEAAEAGAPAARLTSLRRLMAYVRDADEAAYLTRGRELAFLANALLAGCSVRSRPFTPQEASDAAAAVCNLGLEYWPGTSPPDALLIDHDLVTAFEMGWSVLHRDVSLFVAEQLVSTLPGLRCGDRDIRRGLVALRSALVEQRDAGTPWLVRGAAEVLGLLDATACAAVLGLLDECPVMPAALCAVLEGRTSAVSPTEFEFISTAAQIGDVRLFVRKLPDLLSR